MDKVPKLITAQYYTASSKPFRIYVINNVTELAFIVCLFSFYVVIT
jgi:hypothetical protein